MSEPGPSHAPRFLIPAEVALFAVSVATIYGFSRLFADSAFFLPMLAVAVFGHGITAVTRRRGFSVPVAALIAVPLFAVLLSWLFFLDTTLAGIPTGDTLDALGQAIDESWTAFQNVLAPAPALPGFVLASCVALFFAIFLADWAAFRLWSAFEAIVPASTLFIFCSLLGSPVHQVDATAVFLAAVLGFLLLHRIARQETSSSWLTADIERGSRATLRTGAVLTVGALALGVVLGPRLPGADAPAVVSWRDADTGPGSRVTISPLVNIQDRLVNQSETEVFTVRSNQPSYWRMTSLDTFEGDIWRSGGKYSAVDGDLDSFVPQGVTTTDLDQSYTIAKLEVLWLPAVEPRFVNSPSADVRYQADSSTLIVDTDVLTSDGLQYQVRSTQPAFTPEQLQGATQATPQEIVDRYTALPSDFSTKASQQADDVIAAAGAVTAYDKALALQEWFRSPPFTYSKDAPRGHGETAIDEFLDTKIGYCEQYAGTYAAMARAIGLPARVAVGFTPGELDPNDPTLYHVSGKHAHAWPEVYLGEYGWVQFEPTPNRGAPNAEPWTRQPPAQDATVTPTPSTTLVPVPGTDGSNSADQGVNPFDTTTLPTRELDLATDAATSSAFDHPAVKATTGAGTILILLAVYAVVMAWLAAFLHRRRREHAVTDREKVHVAWQESIEALELMGTRAAPSETHDEFARRAVRRLGHRHRPARPGPRRRRRGLRPRARGRRPGRQRGAVRRRRHRGGARAQVSTTQRWFHVLDPRPYLPRRGLSSRHRASSRH